MVESNPRLHHVGIIVPSDDRAQALMDLLQLRESYRGFVSAYAATCIFTAGNGASSIEFVIPTGGKLAEFNQGIGGIHHVALAVDDLTAVAQDLAKRGISLLESEPVRGAGNFLCNFLAPVHTRGFIVEFIQELE